MSEIFSIWFVIVTPLGTYCTLPREVNNTEYENIKNMLCDLGSLSEPDLRAIGLLDFQLANYGVTNSMEPILDTIEILGHIFISVDIIKKSIIKLRKVPGKKNGA